MNSMNTNRLRTIWLVALGSVFGVIATFAVLLGLNTVTGDSADDSEPTIPTTADAKKSRAGRVSSNSAVSNSREQDLGLLNFLVKAPGAFERTEALYSLLHSADEKLLTKLLEQTENISSERLQHTTQIAIVQRLTAIDSKLALAGIENLPNHRHSPLISTVFGEWSLINMDEAVAYAKTLEESTRNTAFQGMLESQVDLPKDIKEGIANELQIDLNIFEQEMFNRTLADEWQDLVTDNQPNLAQTALLIRLAQDWVDQSGLDAIAQIALSLNDPTLKKAILGSVLQRAMLADPDSTLQYALKLEGDLRELTMESIARAWASIGPQEAMESISSIESHRMRRQMLEHFVTAWAKVDPKGMFEEFDLVPENLRVHAEEQAIRTIAQTTPKDAVQFLAEVSDEYLRFDLTMELATSWLDQNAHAALDWALSTEFSNSSLERQVLDTVLRKLAEDNPSLALQTALDQSLDSIGLGLEATVIEAVARTDLERALDMLSQAREGLTQSFSSVAVGKVLVRNGEIDRALELAQQLPEEDRDLYYNLVVNEWAYSNPASLVTELDKLPSAEAKYSAAMDLTRVNVGTNVLTKDQMAYVKGFLPKDYNADTGRRGAESARYARLNNMQNKDLTDEERKQLQRDVQKLLMEGRYRVIRGSSQSLK